MSHAVRSGKIAVRLFTRAQKDRERRRPSAKVSGAVHVGLESIERRYGAVQGAVATWRHWGIRLTGRQVATAPCTVPARIIIFIRNREGPPTGRVFSLSTRRRRTAAG